MMSKPFKRLTDAAGMTVVVNARQVSRAAEVPGDKKLTWLYFGPSEYVTVAADINQIAGWLLETE
jgi:hypothetical protein